MFCFLCLDQIYCLGFAYLISVVCIVTHVMLVYDELIPRSFPVACLRFTFDAQCKVLSLSDIHAGSLFFGIFVLFI